MRAFLVYRYMKLITYEDYEIKISDEAYLVKPIRDLWREDRTKSKEKFLSQMSYVYFMVDPSSSYSYITDLNDRAAAIIEQEGLPKNFKPTPTLQKAMDSYREHTHTTSSLLLEDTKIAIDKVRTFLKDVDLNALDDKNKPIYTINQITASIKMIPDLAKAVRDAELNVAKEAIENGKTRGSMEKKVMEDGATY